MKKKLISIFATMFLVFSCVFLGACQDKYAKMTFEIYYAYSKLDEMGVSHVSEWNSADNGVSLHYGKSTDDFGEEIDSGDKILIKVETKNIQSKKVGNISLSPEQTRGLSIANNTIKTGEYITINLNGFVPDTYVNVMEENSGKSTKFKLSVAPSVESIEVSEDQATALTIGSSIDLSKLNNIQYNSSVPGFETNQFGVNYGIMAIGAFDSEGNFTENNSEIEKITLDGNNLKVGDDFILDNTHYAIQIKATSKFLSESATETEKDDLSTSFYVYIVEKKQTASLVLKYDEETTISDGTIKLYANSEIYNQTTINANISDAFSSIYKDGVYNQNKDIIKFDFDLLVKNENGEFENSSSDEINELTITKEKEKNNFTIKLEEGVNSKIQFKVVYQLSGLQVLGEQLPQYSIEKAVERHTLPTKVLVEADGLKSSSDANINFETDIFSTVETYQGKAVRVDVFPFDVNNTKGEKIILVYDSNVLEIKQNGATLSNGSEIARNSIIYIKFKDNSTKSQIEFQTKSVPDSFNGVSVSANYASTKIQFNNKVTLNKKVEVPSSKNNIFVDSDILVANGKETNVELTLSYSGTLDTSTVKFKIDGDATFNNGKQEIDLQTAITNGASLTSDKLLLPIVGGKNQSVSTISVVVGDGNLGLNSQFTVKSISTADDLGTLSINTSDTRVKEFEDAEINNGKQNFALPVSNKVYSFSVVAENDTTGAIQSLTITGASTGIANIISFDNEFSLLATTAGNDSQKLTAKATYYKYESNTLTSGTQKVEFEIGIYQPIQSITLTAEKKAMCYVNSLLYESSENVFTVTTTGGTQSITYSGEEGADVEITGITGIKLSVSDDLNATLEASKVGDNKWSYTFKLNEQPNVSNFIVTAQATEFDSASGVSDSVSINVLEIEKSNGFTLLDKSQLDLNSDASYTMNLSYLGKAENEEVKKSFSIEANFNYASKTHFDDLTFVLQEVYETATETIYEDIPANSSRITVNMTKVGARYTFNVITHAGQDGGYFRLLVCAKDSYNGKTTLENGEVPYSNFYAVGIAICDGINQAYTISSVEELKLVTGAYKYILMKDLSITSADGFNMLAANDAFNGDFNGNNKTITFTVGFADTGSSTAGLFSTLETNAKIYNLNLVATLNSKETGAESADFGVIAGKNAGTIKNCSVEIVGNSTTIKSSSATINFGVIAGTNSGTIEDCSVQIDDLTLNATKVNVGLVAGVNSGTLIGTYDRTNLTNINYDVFANLTIEATDADTTTVAGVVGQNSGTIENILVGGTIKSNTNLAGVVYNNSNVINNVAILGLDLTADEKDVAGIANTNSGTISYAKVISAKSEFTIGATPIETTGTIKGNNVAGIANTNSGTISYSSVESFLTYASSTNESNETTYEGMTLIGSGDVAGLVLSDTGTTSNSFVRANLQATGNIYLTSNKSVENSYFIGNVVKNDTPGTGYTSNATYAVILNGTNDSIPDIGSLAEDSKYKTDSKNWGTETGYNVVKINESKIYNLPYLLDESGNPLQIIAPTEINAKLNEQYIGTIDATHVSGVGEYESLKDYKITETVVVNYFYNVDYVSVLDTFNTYKLINDSIDSDNPNGLIDLRLVPEKSQSGLEYSIIGYGTNYAKLGTKVDENGTSYKTITFLRASGDTPIIVRARSVFSGKEVYFAFYVQPGASELVLTGSGVGYGDETDYVADFYASYSKQINITALNKRGNVTFNSVFDSALTSSQVEYVVSEVGTEFFDVQVGNNAFTLNLNNSATYNENDEVKFNVILRYKEGVFNQAEIAKTTLTLTLKKGATAIDFTTSSNHDEIASGGVISLDLKLTTNYTSGVDGTKTSLWQPIDSENTIEEEVSSRDGIQISLYCTSGEEQLEKLKDINNCRLIELFDIDAKSTKQSYGYDYNITIGLKEGRNYQYITHEMSFDIIVSPLNSQLQATKTFTIKPTSKISTMRVENYPVKEFSLVSDTRNFINADTIESVVFDPSSNGSLMLVYIEPEYANVTKATLTSSTISVPSLNNEVYLQFTQFFYNEKTNRFETLPASLSYVQDENHTLQLQLISGMDENEEFYYDGILYVHAVTDRFGGVEKTISATLNVETSDGENTITASPYVKNLITQYLPEVKMNYVASSREFKDGYMVQKGTYGNRIELELFGYQFDKNPVITASWDLCNGSEYYYNDTTELKDKDVINKEIRDNGFVWSKKEGKFYKITEELSQLDDASTYYKVNNFTTIKKIGKEDLINVYNYVNIFTDNSATYNATTGAYTLGVSFTVDKDIPCAFKINAEMHLVTRDGSIKNSENKSLTFYPAEYIINDVKIARLYGDLFNLEIGGAKEIELSFATDKTDDISSGIYLDLIKAFTSDDVFDLDAFKGLFSYIDNGVEKSFKDTNTSFDLKWSNNSLAIIGNEVYNKQINFKLFFEYDLDENGIVKVEFYKEENDKLAPKNAQFTLNIVELGTEENATPIRTASDMYNPDGTTRLVENGHYILLADINTNDICPDGVEPINVKIGSFDGNNRTITIGKFKNTITSNGTSVPATEYGLFANLDTYTQLLVDNAEEATADNSVTKTTILKNIIVDYGKFDTLDLTQVDATSFTFGGLIANNGALIYNCDVINSYATTREIRILTKQTTDISVTVGGLVGTNRGTITNSRVGRSEYTKVLVNSGYETETTINLSGLVFVVGNETATGLSANRFQSAVGGFVGTNSGTISSSFVMNTGIANYSNSTSTNRTAGFVATNSGVITNSYVKGETKSHDSNSEYFTDNDSTNSKTHDIRIENKGNGSVAGFAYINSGTISNAFANTELCTISANSAGFVFNNQSGATIENCYAACTFNVVSNADETQQPFVGKEGTTLNSNGKIENSYFLSNGMTLIDSGLPQAIELNLTAFQDSENLNGFVFVLSTSEVERNQGVWSYYDVKNNRQLLPEITSANQIAISYRYFKEQDKNGKYVYTNAVKYAQGKETNPFIIRDDTEFNNILTGTDGGIKNISGYFKLIDNIDFSSTSINTKLNYTFGSQYSTEISSFDGNGLKISNIYLSAGDSERGYSVGLFSKIQNSYIKNITLEFESGTFSTSLAKFSGGLAGQIDNSVIINVNLNGSGTVINGNNIVGGLAGIITGKSVVKNITSNISVNAGSQSSNMYYSADDYKSKGTKYFEEGETTDYISTLSFAGGLAGVVDIKNRNNETYNLSDITINGDEMTKLTINDDSTTQQANILACHAGGVAGYIGENVKSERLKYYFGATDRIQGLSASGGLVGVSLGAITASQVTVDEIEQDEEGYTDSQKYDNFLKEYILTGSDSSTLTSEEYNLNLLSSKGYTGGLVGVNIGGSISASYSKASIANGVTVGGLVGVSVASSITYSYAVPFVNLNNNMQNVGGLIGSAYGIKQTSPARNEEISVYNNIAVAKLGTTEEKHTSVSFTFSTLLLNKNTLKRNDTTKIDYLSADYKDATDNYIKTISDNALTQVYVGTYAYDGEKVENSNEINLKTRSLQTLYDVSASNISEQYNLFNEIFLSWQVVGYWSFDNLKYFPLLLTESNKNEIHIKEESDFAYIRANPNGNYVIDNDIELTEKYGNYVLDINFTGTIRGEKLSATKKQPAKISNIVLKPTASGGTGSGFFRSIGENAIVSNLIFEYTSITPQSDNLEIGLLTPNATGADISAVSVQINNGNIDKNGSAVLDLTNKTIKSFAGLIGNATGVNITDAKFTGTVNANLANTEDVFFAGLIGNAEAKQGESMTISSSLVGSTTQNAEFNVEVGACESAYIGGAIGKITNGAISSIKVGVGTSNPIIPIKMNVTFNNTTANAYIGGLMGYNSSSSVSSSDVVADITLNTKMTGQGENQTVLNSIKLGGLIGGIQAQDKYIRSTNAKTNIDTTKLDANTIMVSGGVGSASGINLVQCLFTGEINTVEGTENNNSLQTVYAGGVIATTSGTANLSEVVSNVAMTVGSTGATKVYAGGFVGQNTGTLTINDAVTSGRIIPVNASESSIVYAGGLVGKSTGTINAENIISTSSLIQDSISANTMSGNKINALVGDGTTAKNSECNVINVFFSVDVSLATDTFGTNINSGNFFSSNNAMKDGLSDNSELWSATSNVPYLATMLQAMRTYEIMSAVGGSAGNYDYTLGTSLNPISISNDTTSWETSGNYTYYLVDAKLNDDNSLQTFSTIKFKDSKNESTTNLNGMIIGNETDIIVSSPLVETIEKHSVVSNIHVQLTDNTTISSNGLVAKTNNGMMFNCSVQGHGLKIETVSSAVGLVVGANNGLVHSSYSSAEILSTDTTIGGIVGENSDGNIVSCFFTGYINNDNKTAGGIVGFANSATYLYNCYNAGVITQLGENSILGGIGGSGSVSYENCYIDQYANNEKVKSDGPNIIGTKALMQVEGTSGLAGNWHYVYENSKTNTSLFDKNFGYPILDLGKEDNIDYNHQNETGKGTASGDLASRYDALLSSNSADYANAVKIPHLGLFQVLGTLVSKLDNQDLNYVLIYDIKGCDSWTANWNFTGVFVSNPNFNFTENKKATISEINGTGLFDSEIKGTGLFASVSNAYIGHLTLGSFSKTTGTTGPIAVTVSGVTTINDVNYSEDASIKGEYVGGLVNTISGNLTVSTFTSGATSGSNTYVLTISATGNAGLIASSMTTDGTLTLGDANELYVQFSGCNLAGGLIGEMSGGSIVGDSSNTTINIIAEDDGDTPTTNKTIGGIVGRISGDVLSNTEVDDGGNKIITDGIQQIIVNFVGNSIKTNTFGGLVGEVGKVVEGGDKINVNVDFISCLITQSSNKLTIYSTSTGDEEHFVSLLAGKVASGSVSASTFGTNIKSFTVKGTTSAEDSKNTGVGLFAGSQGGDIHVSLASDDNVLKQENVLTIYANNISNLGGISGIYNSGMVDIDTGTKLGVVTLCGTTNVGGVFGNVQGGLSGVTPTEESSKWGKNFENLLGGTKHAVISFTGFEGNSNVSITYRNIGGLFGVLKKSGTSTAVTNVNPINIVGNNTAIVEVKNVGGVAGKYIASEANDATYENKGDIKTQGIEANKIGNDVYSGKVSQTLSINVGGVFGTVEAEDNSSVTATLKNNASVSGYKNVGGLIGSINELKMTIDGDNTSGGNVIGAINVGGVVGNIVGKVSDGGTLETSIQNMSFESTVYGNFNVGGIAGYVENVNISNNTVSGKGGETGTVVAKYYECNYLDNDNEEQTVYYIPTSIGGLVGSVSEATLIQSNTINNVVILSDKESEGDTIKTNKNYMLSSSNKSYLTSKKPIEKVDFNGQRTGFGGIVGTFVENDRNFNMKSNEINSLTINAQLGVNVGTIAGYAEISSEKSEDHMPTISGTNTIDGAYQVGGLIGYLDATNSSSYISYSDPILADGETSTSSIYLQSNITGFYVGGLFGKLYRYNDVENLIIENNGKLKIYINTDQVYYSGGLVGTFVTKEATFNGQVGGESTTNPIAARLTSAGEHETINIIDSDGVVNVNMANNFGGLIGKLKVEASGNGGYSVNVTGTHYYPFTVNVIENSNYSDGNTTYKTTHEGTDTNLIAQASYTNLDSFTISPTSETSIYDISATNPTRTGDSAKTGWAKDYTMFKIMQRYEEQSNEDWPAISVVYDARFITGVGTIENLNLGETDLLSGVDIENKEGIKKKFDPDYICYTIYEPTEGQAQLYSAIGIAEIYYDDDGDIARPHDTTNGALLSLAKWVGAVFDWTSPPQNTYYIDLSNEAKGTQGLTYLVYSYNKKEGETDITNFEDFTYKTVDGSEDGSGVVLAGTNDDTNMVLGVVYNAKKYRQENAWFEFKVLYENASVPKVTVNNNVVSQTWDETKDNSMAKSGSLFEVNGKYTSESKDAMTPSGEKFNWVKYIGYAIDAIALVATFGGSGAFTAIKAATKASIKVIKNVAKKIAGKAIKKFTKKQIATALIGIAATTALSFVIFGQQSATVVQNYIQYSIVGEEIGFLAESYQRAVSYQDNIFVTQTDSARNIHGNSYVYCSSNRPKDYYEKIYLTYYVDNDDNDNFTFTETSYSKNDKITIEDIEYTVSEDSLKYYEFFDGAYYVLTEAAVDIEMIYGSSIDTTKYKENRDYIYSNGEVFVRGSFKGTTYNFAQTCDNKISAIKDSSYTIDSRVYETSENTSVEKTLHYVLNSQLTKVINTNEEKQNEEKNKGIIKVATDDILYKGYGYMKGLYYTPNGTHKNYKMYATYNYAGTTKPDGTEGVYYFVMNEYVYDKDNNLTDTIPHYYTFTNTEAVEATSVYDINNLNGGEYDGAKSYTITFYGESFDKPKSEAYLQDSNIYTIDDSNQSDLTYKATYYMYEGGYKTLTFGEGDDAKNAPVVELLNLNKGENETDEAYNERVQSYRNKTITVYYKDPEATEYKSTLLYYYNDTPDKEGKQPLLKKSLLNKKTDGNYEIKSSITIDEKTYNTTDLYIYDPDIYASDNVDISNLNIPNNLKIDKNILYKKDDNGVIDDDGRKKLVVTVMSFSGDDYNAFKWTANSKAGLYTRYKYSDLDKFKSNTKWDAKQNYYIYMEGSNNPNAGTTIFTEGCRVILSGAGKGSISLPKQTQGD